MPGEPLSLNFIEQVDVRGKTLLLRVDINSSVVEGRVIVSSRLRDHSLTIQQLSDRGARVVVLSHQGRLGEPDFIPLERHANLIRKLLQREVSYLSWENDFVAEIKKMKDGDILVLDNTRFQKDESLEKTPAEHAKDKFIQQLAKAADLFVQDALSICHRPHATVVGFSPLLPCYVGPALKKELDALERLSNITENRLAVLGGAKPADSVKLLARLLNENVVDSACVGGLFGELFLFANGVPFGEKEAFFREKGFLALLSQLKALLERYPRRIVLPVDLVLRGNGKKRKTVSVKDFPVDAETVDVGRETVDLFKKHIKASQLVIFNGPLGVYEDPAYSIGTKKVLECIAFNKKTFSILGGGDTERCLSTLGLLREDFSHVSLAGKALLQYLSGNELPGLVALKQNAAAKK